MKLAHLLEAAVAHAAVRLLRVLSPERASNLCGRVARAIGPLLPVSRIAHINLAAALPELDAAARKATVRGVWENLGRTAGEFVHLGRLQPAETGIGWQVAGEENLLALVRAGGPAIVFSAHIGNWEMVPRAVAHRGIHFATVYRPADNPFIDRMILRLRHEAVGGREVLIAKGAKGARQALLQLRSGGFLGLLPDQKMNDGIEARLFGMPAMTAPAMAALGLRLRCPIVPAYVQRLAPARFLVTYEPPLELPDSGDRAADVLALTQAVNDRFEAWIRAKPESWLWLHRRWPKPLYER